MSRIFRFSGLVALCIACVIAAGCMTPMALTAKTPTPVVGPEKGLVLLVVETTKEGAGSWSRLPVLDGISVVPAGGSKEMVFRVPSEVKTCDNNAVAHLISLSLPVGEYRIENIWGSGLVCWEVGNFLKGPLGGFSFPVNANMASLPGKIVYAGHIHAHMRPRTAETETHAASILPLLDQQVAGFYPTTFDVAIVDDLENDLSRFVAKFPALKKEDVSKLLSTRNIP